MMRTVILVAPVVSVTGNCAAAAYAFCCGVGTKCDCNKGISAPGQCDGHIAVPIIGKVTSYSYCCGMGTPCDCGVSANHTEMKELVAQDVEVPLSVEVIDILLTSSTDANQHNIVSSNERLINGDFHYDGTITVVAVGSIHNAQIIEASSGCGANHQKCGCDVTGSKVHMHGAGTDGTATGLDFKCEFYVDSVRCEVHVDIPYVGGNSIGCNCGTEGFEWFGCSIGSGHSFTDKMLVQRSAALAVAV